MNHFYNNYVGEYNFFLNKKINNEHDVEKFKLLLPYITVNDLLIRDDKGNTFWHRLFSNINNKYQIEVIKLLLPFITIEDMKIKNRKKRTCLHELFKNISSYSI